MNYQRNLIPLLLAALCSVLLISGCSSDNTETPTQSTVAMDSDTPTGEIGLANTSSLAANGCQNVIIIDEFAYAACGDGIEIVNLNTFERNFITSPADDISGDAGLGVLFTQSRNTLQQFDLTVPLQPNLVASTETNFSIFSGISAANGILVVSAGAGGSNTEVYSYDATTLTLLLDGIPMVDGQTGNPDVHVSATADGAIAFYSQDIGEVANWGIQIVEFDTVGNFLELPEVVVLTPGPFTGGFGEPFAPANFPVESERLGDNLYVANFAASGIEIVDLSASNALSTIPLGYEPTNIATDGELLFVVSAQRSTVDIISPDTASIIDNVSLPLVQPIGVAANTNYLAVADRSAGLIVVSR